jgi:hypothetical protein
MSARSVMAESQVVNGLHEWIGDAGAMGPLISPTGTKGRRLVETCAKL